MSKEKKPHSTAPGHGKPKRSPAKKAGASNKHGYVEPQLLVPEFSTSRIRVNEQKVIKGAHGASIRVRGTRSGVRIREVTPPHELSAASWIASTFPRVLLLTVGGVCVMTLAGVSQPLILTVLVIVVVFLIFGALARLVELGLITPTIFADLAKILFGYIPRFGKGSPPGSSDLRAGGEDTVEDEDAEDAGGETQIPRS